MITVRVGFALSILAILKMPSWLLVNTAMETFALLLMVLIR